MPKDQVQRLAEDILANGLRENLLVTADRTTLVDGRARLLACGIAGVAPRYSYLPEGTSEAEIIRLMVQSNLKTRKLTPGQLAMLGNAVAREIESVPREDLKNYPPIRSYDNKSSASWASALVGVSSKAMWQAKMIRDHNPEMEDRVRSGELRLNTAYEQVMTSRGLRNAPSNVDMPHGLSRRPPHPRDATRRAVEDRRAWLVHLAGQNLNSLEISKKLGISEEHIRRLARQYDIELTGDAWSYKRRKPNLDINRVAQVVADDLVALEDSIQRIRNNIEQLDPEKMHEWAQIYHKSYRELRKLSEALGYGTFKKRMNDDNDDSA